MKKLLSMMVAAFVLSACAMGTPINWNKARQVQVGMNEAQVTALMGRPYMVTSRPDGQRWIWVLGTSWGSSQSMSIVLKDGKVTEVPVIPTSFGS
jgi:outer membrane protein assembly factor BamE (lipoprotein component of BamABCDE complex)